ncbi:hypothetical protein [Halopenitus persicus]|uniref:Uncharacterized protein n=1 Tax=Halopenitus persicus TaxID=1048396 RepID=A0A1H3NPY6_9EURY|nr:hypothetical protein [Halopenitus persicus]SDY90894.1 hypothetical protein SAMN05216564_11425 [Halopenitus persicus]
MKILIIDQCSGAKEYPDESPVFDADEIDAQPREELFEQEGVARLRARDLYKGRQQQYISEAVDALRETGYEVDRYFISAGFGLVEETEELPPYEVTFNEMLKEELLNRRTKLGIPQSVRELFAVEKPYDIVFFALGSKYYLSIDVQGIMSEIPSGTWGVLFNQAEVANGRKNLISIPARTDEAKENGSIVVALKGTYLKNFASNLSAGNTIETISDIEEFCTSEPTAQLDFKQFEDS